MSDWNYDNFMLIIKLFIRNKKRLEINGRKLDFHEGCIWELYDVSDTNEGYTKISTYDKVSNITFNEFLKYICNLTRMEINYIRESLSVDENPIEEFIKWADNVFFELLQLIRKYEPELEGKLDCINDGYDRCDKIKELI